MSKAPAFQLYAADFYMDTLTWETDDIGTYFCLLMAEWVNGPLENDTRKLAKIAKKTHQKFLKNWSKISQKFLLNNDGFLVNFRLEEEREKQHIHSKKQSDRASARWRNSDATADATAEPRDMPPHMPEGCSSSSSSSSLEDKALKATPEPFRLPTQEELENFSPNKIIEVINRAADDLYDKKIWLKVHAYKNAMLKRGCNPRAVMKTLCRCLIRPPENPWAYCCAIMKKEDGNFNARDYEKDHG